MAIKVIHRQVKSKRPKILVILGTTASGKTSLGIKLAAEFDGEIVSADSRQVYRGMDVGTGKDLADYEIAGRKIDHHLIDVASPDKKFDLAQYQKKAFSALEKILSKHRLPIIVGGSGLYIQALVDNYELGKAVPDPLKRAEREKLGAPALLELICGLKPDFADRLNNSDRNNARRLARYLEILEAGTPSPRKRETPYDFLLLGLTWPDEVLRERISYRLLQRLEQEGMVAEVKKLNDQGVSWEQLESFGLEYRFISRHLRGEQAYTEMVSKLETAIYRFAKRQKTWFKRWEKQGTAIHWTSDLDEARRLTARWLKK